MVPGGPEKSESMPMDVDDDIVPPRHQPHQWDSPSGGSVSSNLPLPSHPAGSRGHPPLMVPSLSPLPANEEHGNIYDNQGLTLQRRDIPLKPPAPEPPARKRKYTDDALHLDTMGDEVAPRDSSRNPPSSRRVRPRLRMREDREFSPLLIMSPRREPSGGEETISAFHYPPSMTGSFHSIQRYFHIGEPQHGPSISQSSSSSKFSDQDVQMERWRSDSAHSFAEVALASIVTPRHGRLSTLQDFCLPRPFEEAEQPSSQGSVVVHERGIEAGPLFISTQPGQMSGPSMSREVSELPRLAVPPVELGSTKYFDKPLCESPDSIDPAEDSLAHHELPTIRVTQTGHDSPETCSSHGRQ